jgi:hypothetical protein
MNDLTLMDVLAARDEPRRRWVYRIAAALEVPKKRDVAVLPKTAVA